MSPGLARAFKERLLNRFATVNEAPVLVLGNQKCGTTPIAALLAQAVGSSVTLDIRGIYEPVQTRLHRGELTFDSFVADNRLDFSREIVKEPNLTFLYEELSARFPASSMVFINRDPRTNIKSILNRLSLPGDIHELNEALLREVSPEWRLALDGSWLGLEGGNYIEMLAARWNLAADTYLENAADMPLVLYEDFFRNKVGEIYRLAERLGLRPINDISGSVDRQYQPRGDKSITVEDFFGTENLSSIERICGERMREFGYTPRAG